MTKTFTTGVLHRFTNLGLPLLMPLGTSADRLFVLNFEFGSFEFV
jgi:hypothetical protein